MWHIAASAALFSHYLLRFLLLSLLTDSDCAPGLVCFRRNAFEAVPGCIGGENSDSYSDFCVFDPYGDGYFPPTETPTIAPTVTARPSLSPLDPIPLQDFGGTPPASRLPLQLCQGDVSYKLLLLTACLGCCLPKVF